MLIGRASRAVASAGLLRITVAGARTTDDTSGGELARTGTAVLVGRITDGVRLELASIRVTAAVCSAANLSTAIAVLATLDDAVSTLAADKSLDVLVVSQAVALDVALESRADVTDTAW